MSKQKKKFSPGGVIGIAVSLLIGGSIGYFGASFADQLSGGSDSLFFLYIGVMFLGLLAAYFLHIIIHEGGHFLFGLMSGYQFVSFNVLGFIWQKGQDGKLRLGRMQIAGAGGQCLMAPPDYNGGRFPFTLYNLGGVLMNLLWAGLCALLAWVIPTAPVLRILLVTQAIVGVGIALLNGLPIPVAAIQNDGKNLLCIRKDETARQAFWVQMAIAADIARGVRLKDMPEDWFAPFPEAALDNPIVCAIPVMHTSRLMDQLNFAAAEQEIRALLAREKGVLGLYRTSMACDGAVCELLAGRPGELVSALAGKEHQAVIKAMSGHPAILRTQYALALLHEKDGDKAAKLLTTFEAAAIKHPNPQEITGERELLACIQEAAQ